MSLIDAHAHLNEQSLARFLEQIDYLNLKVISNSIDIESSKYNINLGKQSKSVIPFVGIHPEIFKEGYTTRGIHQTSDLDLMVSEFEGIYKLAKGIGEVGLDQNYGHFEEQQYLLEKILSLCERTKLPITFHCRDSVTRILEMTSTFGLASKILFHWFSGSEEDLRKIQAIGAYVSFGPSILFSKRLESLVRFSDPDLILAETDSPTMFRSILESVSYPTLVCSVAFKIGLILNKSFGETVEKLRANTETYLSSQD